MSNRIRTDTGEVNELSLFGTKRIDSKLAELTPQSEEAPAGTASGVWNDMAETNTAIGAINNNRQRIAELEQRLKDLGCLS